MRVLGQVELLAVHQRCLALEQERLSGELTGEQARAYIADVLGLEPRAFQVFIHQLAHQAVEQGDTRSLLTALTIALSTGIHAERLREEI